jgi:hypothetical protein
MDTDNEQDIRNAVKALRRWFQSQEISPSEAGICMVRLMAELLTEKTSDMKELACGIALNRDLLTVEIADCIKNRK